MVVVPAVRLMAVSLIQEETPWVNPSLTPAAAVIQLIWKEPWSGPGAVTGIVSST